MFSIYCRPRNNVIILLFLFVANIKAYFLDPLLSNGEFELGKRNLAPRSLERGTTLRILCLGASITYGYHSSDGNGYRYALRGKLVEQGNDVNMIGYVSHGNMSNNKVEAFPGHRIDQVVATGNLSLPEMPNVVLIFLGTNDMAQNYQVSTAPVRMGNLVDHILNVVPNTTVIVGTLLPNAKPSAETNILAFNAALPGVISNLTSQGKKVSLVDFHSDWFSTADLGPDGTHPTDMGYLKMARVFYTGIVAAAEARNITAPTEVAGVDDYKAGNDSSQAGMAMDVVCQGPINGTAQKMQCSEGGTLQVWNACFVLATLVASIYSL